MKYTHQELGYSLRSLLFFIFWYALVVGLVLYVLPAAGLFLETGYENLPVLEKVLILAGLLVGVAIGQYVAHRRKKHQNDARMITIRGDMNKPDKR
ncbi:MAG TPA: hypothetical protein VKN35_03920 [Xanthomonadales bacterium]|nr:hypothetical protein [Xanthomonadales bacterium]